MKSFHQRREEYLAQVKRSKKRLGLAELLAQVPLPTSEERLATLPATAWSPGVFRDAVVEFAEAVHLTINNVERGEQASQRLSAETEFKYASNTIDLPHSPQSAETILVTVVEENRIIGYGYGIQQPTAPKTIKIIDVDVVSRRSSGLQMSFLLGEHYFAIGVGHVLVNALISAMETPIEVDATNAESRYIFMSLGFVPNPNSDNPCDLVLL